MDGLEVLDIAHDAIWTILRLIMPLMLAGMTIGLIISFFQAITQIQEMTLTFVPKILIVFVLLLFLLPSMGSTMQLFSEDLFDKISHLSNNQE